MHSWSILKACAFEWVHKNYDVLIITVSKWPLLDAKSTMQVHRELQALEDEDGPIMETAEREQPEGYVHSADQEQLKYRFPGISLIPLGMQFNM